MTLQPSSKHQYGTFELRIRSEYYGLTRANVGHTSLPVDNKQSMEDFNAYQVPALKHYLCTKGITTSIYRKADLIKLCELAREIDLEDIQTEDDYVDMDVRRRTVGDLILPSVGEVGLQFYFNKVTIIWLN